MSFSVGQVAGRDFGLHPQMLPQPAAPFFLGEQAATILPQRSLSPPVGHFQRA
jgi:hypothetical protein